MRELGWSLLALAATAVPLLLAWWLLGRGERKARDVAPTRRGKIPPG